MTWVEVKPGAFRWEPAPGHVYECERVNGRSSRHFARHNRVVLRTPRGSTFRGSIEDCKALCERHHEVNTIGGEVP